MRYFFIYSAGGGAGDWNGLKRIWVSDMPIVLKENILLKFGDVFFNHASLNNLIKPRLWITITDMRNWLYTAVGDNYVNTTSKLLLDSGTSKVVSLIITQNPRFTPIQVVNAFDNLVTTNNILNKYVDIIQTSRIDEAVTFDIPNPFKIRTQTSNTTTSIFASSSNALMISTSARYCNEIYRLLGNSQVNLLTIINGLWNVSEISQFLNSINYQPDKIAIGGLTRVTNSEFGNALQTINSVINFTRLNRVHLLGCGGIKKVNEIKATGFNSPRFSVDNSTPYNRAIDGNISGTKFSGYFDYSSKALTRIKQLTVNQILGLHQRYATPIFSRQNMNNILASILQHQSGNSNHTTYENRARLIIHNHDVFRLNAI